MTSKNIIARYRRCLRGVRGVEGIIEVLGGVAFVVAVVEGLRKRLQKRKMVKKEPPRMHQVRVDMIKLHVLVGC